MKQPNGFTLIELLIGLAIAVVVAAAMVGLTRSWLNVSNQQQSITTEASELADVYTATQTYLSRNVATIPAGTSAISVGTLITPGLLPARFALRNGIVGTSPWFQRYGIMVNKHADGTTRALIYERLAANATRLAHTGVSASTQALTTLKTVLATRLNSDYHLPAGTLTPGSSVATGVFGSFSKDLSADISSSIGSAINQPSIAILVGFSDLSAGGSDVPPTGLPRTNLLGCVVVHPTIATGSGPTCPATTPAQVAKWPYCAPWNNNFQKYAAYPSNAGTITSGTIRHAEQKVFICTDFMWHQMDVWDMEPPGIPTNRYSMCPSYQNETDTALAYIQGGRFLDEGCADIRNGLGSTGSCTPLSGVDLAHGSACAQTTVRPEIASMGANSYNILCCAQ
ncbi:MAG: prepilin-type N-terminal cleavage/methylation domain-containing protein [Dokdonella sp.]